MRRPASAKLTFIGPVLESRISSPSENIESCKSSPTSCSSDGQIECATPPLQMLPTQWKRCDPDTQIRTYRHPRRTDSRLVATPGGDEAFAFAHAKRTMQALRATVNEGQSKRSPCAATTSRFANITPTTGNEAPRTGSHAWSKRLPDRSLGIVWTCRGSHRTQHRTKRVRLWDEPAFARPRITATQTCKSIGDPVHGATLTLRERQIPRVKQSASYEFTTCGKRIASASATCIVSTESSGSSHGCCAHGRRISSRLMHRCGPATRSLPYVYPQHCAHDGATFFATRL